jgi:hypothetical protein
MMVSTRVLHTGCSESSVARSQTKVDVLEREEILVIQEADRLEYFTSDEHHAAAHRINARRRPRSNSRHSSSRRPVTHTTRAPRKRNPGRRYLVWFFAREKDWRRNPQRQMALHRTDQLSNCIGSQDHVAIHEEDELRAAVERGTNSEIAPSGESTVLL